MSKWFDPRGHNSYFIGPRRDRNSSRPIHHSDWTDLPEEIDYYFNPVSGAFLDVHQQVIFEVFLLCHEFSLEHGDGTGWLLLNACEGIKQVLQIYNKPTRQKPTKKG